MKKNSPLDTVDQIASHAKRSGIAHLHTLNDRLDSNRLKLNEVEAVSFGSCSYLGLEFEPALRDAAKQGIDCFGTQFSSSRAYISLGYYNELETKLNRLFQAHVVVTPTTTLGHIGAIPVLVDSDHAVIMDHQVHNSVQTAVNLVKAKNVHVELVRHNRMDLLEKQILELRGKYRKIWYMADGVYSMFGDLAPMDEIVTLLEKYPELHFYVDDAHAMSAYGSKGRGYVLGSRDIHERMIVAVSLNKAFATGGGALIFPTAELAQRIKNCASTLITSGPMQPSALAAAIACVDLHLSGKIEDYQVELAEKIKYTHLLLKKYGLPNLAEASTPIFFVAVGLPKVGYNLINRLMNSGFYLNLGIFPAVPIKNTGVRFTITRLHTLEQIEAMVRTMALHYDLALEEEGVSREEVYRAFRLPLPEEQKLERHLEAGVNHTNLISSHYKSILEIPKEEWDKIMAGRGIFDWHTLNILENSFTGNEKPEDNWKFDYLMVRDFSGKVVLATFMTCSLTKDDMLSHETISRDIERTRMQDPYFFISRTLALGSQITEGNHLYLDETSSYRQEALSILLQKMDALQQDYQATTVMLRDLPANKPAMDDLMVDNGFFKVNLPDSYKVTLDNWNSETEFYNQLSKRSKRHFKENILRHSDALEVTIDQQLSTNEIEECYKLYLSVKEHSLALNTFKLPYKLFEKICTSGKWDIIRLWHLDDNQVLRCAGMVLAYGNAHSYAGVIVGLDYEINAQVPVYRRSLYEVLLQGKRGGYLEASYGFSAEIEKRKFGALPVAQCAYMQLKDNYSMYALNVNSVHAPTQSYEPVTDERRI